MDNGEWRMKANYQLSTINYQLSTVNCQLSTVNCQLSTINYIKCSAKNKCMKRGEMLTRHAGAWGAKVVACIVISAIGAARYTWQAMAKRR
jgi:hypothetical protein